MKLLASPVKEYALEKGFKIYQPIKVRKNEEFINEVRGLNPDVLVVVAYGKILPKEILEIPKYGAINVHGSLLPKYRGAAPIQWAVINGEAETGITTMFMDEGMDTGDMILKESTKIGEDETTGELWERMSYIGSKLLVQTLEKIDNIKEKDKLSFEELKIIVGAEKQGEDFSVAPMLQKEIAKIDWSKSGIEIKNLVRGLNPIIGAYSMLNGKKIKFWKVDLVTNNEIEREFPETKEYAERISKIENGTILFADKKKGIFVKTNDGAIALLELQGENSKKMDFKSFLNGNNVEAGEIFE